MAVSDDMLEGLTEEEQDLFKLACDNIYASWPVFGTGTVDDLLRTIAALRAELAEAKEHEESTERILSATIHESDREHRAALADKDAEVERLKTKLAKAVGAMETAIGYLDKSHKGDAIVTLVNALEEIGEADK